MSAPHVCKWPDACGGSGILKCQCGGKMECLGCPECCEPVLYEDDSDDCEPDFTLEDDEEFEESLRQALRQSERKRVRRI